MTEPSWTPLTREQAVAEGWEIDEAWPDSFDWSATVTLACDEYILTDRDIRQLMRQTLSWGSDKAQAIWAEVGEVAGSENGPDQMDVFRDRFGPLLPHEHDWMLFGAVLRDAVTAYEVYLGKALDQAMAHHRVQRKSPEAPRWGELRRWYRLLGLDPRPTAVDEAVELRNLLTHQRGELRTPGQRALFGADRFGLNAAVAHLDEQRVQTFLDALAANVREVDPVMWAYTYRDHPVPDWDTATA